VLAGVRERLWLACWWPALGTALCALGGAGAVGTSVAIEPNAAHGGLLAKLELVAASTILAGAGLPILALPSVLLVSATLVVAAALARAFRSPRAGLVLAFAGLFAVVLATLLTPYHDIFELGPAGQWCFPLCTFGSLVAPLVFARARAWWW